MKNEIIESTHGNAGENFKVGGKQHTNMRIAAELMALPNRGGLMLSEIAERAGISERGFYKWRQDPRFQAMVETNVRNNVKEVMPNVFESIVKKAVEGSAKHAELLLKYQGLLTDRHEFVAVDERKRHDIDGMKQHDAELDNEINELKKMLDGDNDE